MKDAVLAFAVGLGLASLILFFLMGRSERRADRGRVSAARGESGGGSFESGGDSGGHLWSWLGGEHSRTDGSGHSDGSGGWEGGDSGGGSGGDSGGAGGDGGGDGD